MAKFNLKEHIAKNKSTFFGSLTEGQFSWMTQDTGQQIGSQDENMIPVYMFDDKGKYYYENDYEGYGVFGGMDYYELLDKMNGGIGDGIVTGKHVYRDRKSTRLNSSHSRASRMPSSA